MKTLEQLKEIVKVTWIGYGTLRVEITYNGKKYSCNTHNTLATDRLKDDDYIRDRSLYGSKKQAYLALYEECKQKNNIGKYRY